MMVEESVSSKVRMINSGIIIKGFTTVLLEIIINDSYGDTSKFERSCHIFRMKGGEFFLNPLGWKPNGVVDSDVKCKKWQ